MNPKLVKLWRAISSSDTELKSFVKSVLNDYYSRVPQNLPSYEALKDSGANFQTLIDSVQSNIATSVQLACNEKPFEAYILLRSALEGTLYIWKICNDPDSARTATSFFKDLFEAYLSQDDARTRAASDLEAKNWMNPLVSLGKAPEPVPSYFSDAKKALPNKGARNPIINAWSCSVILDDLEKADGYLDTAIALRSIYSFTSHLAHSDPCGLKIRCWRNYTKNSLSIEDGFIEILNVCFFAISLARLSSQFVESNYKLPKREGIMYLSKNEKKFVAIFGALRQRINMLRDPEFMKLSDSDGRKRLAALRVETLARLRNEQ